MTLNAWDKRTVVLWPTEKEVDKKAESVLVLRMYLKRQELKQEKGVRIPIPGPGLSDRLLGLLRFLRLGGMLRFMLKHAPKKVQTRAEDWRTSILVRNVPKYVPEQALEDKYREVLLLLMEKCGSESLGDYLEFGVCYGTSIACMYRALKALGLERTRLIGFDSFEGLPDIARTDSGGVWCPGQFKSEIEFTKQFLAWQGVNPDRTILIKGLFSDTLNDALVQKHKITKASVIMVDCDLYQSAKEALDFCAPLIQDAAIILFDDWHSGGGLAQRNLGEKRAFDEFVSKNPQFTSEQLSSYHPNAEVFLVKRVP